MVRYRRNIVPGGKYFFTVTVRDRRSRILVEHLVSLRQAFRTTRTERPFTIDAIVILPDHLHAILTLPPGDSDFSGRWRRIKGLLTRDIASGCDRAERDQRGEYTLWQRRFWEHTIRDDADFSRHVDYIHYNPVKHGLVAQVRHWPYSSFHRYVRQGWVTEDWEGASDSAATGFGERHA